MTHVRRQRRLERDVVALADGSLPANRRARVECALAASSSLRASLAGQRRALKAISESALPGAPSALRARVELARDPRPARGAPKPRVALAGGLTAALTALVTLVIAVGSSASPTIASASTLGWRPPTAPLSVAADDHGALPGVSAAGIDFPDWAARFGLQASGMRRDQLGGRLATTVFYERSGDRIAYTIVSGAPLSAGATAHERVWDGTRLASLSIRGRVVVSWLRDGHTCVLSATGTPATTLALLASTEAGTSTY